MLLVEVLRRFFGGEAPIGSAMMAMAAANMVVNLVCLRLLSRRRRDADVNVRASVIFTGNDTIVNLGIIVSAGLVMWLDSNMPDLLLGVVVVGVVAHGGKEILEDARETAASKPDADAHPAHHQ